MIDYTLNEIAEALDFLHPDNTDEWLLSGMALKKEYGEDAFDTWDYFSSKYSKYSDKECRTRWKSFKGSSSRGSVSVAYILKLAFSRGYTRERPEFTAEQKAAYAAEHEKRRRAVEDRCALDEENTRRWHEAVADASARLMQWLKPTGTSRYLGKKKIHSCGCLFAPHGILLDYKPDFTIDILIGDAIKPVFDRVKANKAANIDSDDIVYFKRGAILLPLFDPFHPRPRNFQIIYNDGTSKRFLKNGQISGLYFVIGNLEDDLPILFCEGFATGGSLRMATGYTVVVCFNAGNMVAVAEHFKDDPRDKLFAGDNDWKVALDPKKKNTGREKAQQAALICRARWCVPQFSDEVKALPHFVDDEKAPTDFNDLHVVLGLAAVKEQIDAVLVAQPVNFMFASGDPDVLPLDTSDLQYVAYFPLPDYSDIPLPDSAHPSLLDSPDPSLSVDQMSVESLITRYALTDPDAKVWDSFQKKIIKATAFKNIVRPTIYKQWLEHDKRRTVLLEDVQRQAAAAQKKGRGGLAEALNRYVYLNPSDTAWDKQEREIVALSHLKYAIADCFASWVSHPDREEIPHRFLVFDPTQKCDTKTHINQFRGLATQPRQDDARCRRIIEMLMALCNNDMKVFKWLRRWLAYPLINVGAKMETSVLCHSDVHGSGKSYFFDVVMRAIYGEYSRTVGQAQLEGQYNDWMSKVLYCVYEEVLSRSEKYSHTGTIKQTITGKTVRIEKKFMSGWEEANHMNAVFLSNEVLPLPVEPADRRFLVIWPETKLYEHLQRGVNEDLENGGAEAFYHFLLQTNMQERSDNPELDEPFPFDEHTKPPMTAAKERLIEHGRAIWEVFYNEWARGDLMFNDQNVPYCCMRISDLFKFFETWCSRNKERGMGAHKFSSYISSKLKKRPDLHYEWLTAKGKSGFYIVGKCPEDKTQEQWLGACVMETSRILNTANDLAEGKAA